MDSVIATSTDRMQSDINTLKERLDNMDRAINEAWEAMEDLHSSWEGMAHMVLDVQIYRDQEMMKSMMIELRNYLEEIENAKKEYVTCEGSVESLMNSMRV